MSRRLLVVSLVVLLGLMAVLSVAINRVTTKPGAAEEEKPKPTKAQMDKQLEAKRMADQQSKQHALEAQKREELARQAAGNTKPKPNAPAPGAMNIEGDWYNRREAGQAGVEKVVAEDKKRTEGGLVQPPSSPPAGAPRPSSSMKMPD